MCGRPTELLMMQQCDIDGDAGTIRIRRPHRPDPARGHEIPLPPALIAALREWLRTRGTTRIE